MPPEAPAMPTVCLRFRFPEQTMEACGSILQQAVDYALNHPQDRHLLHHAGPLCVLPGPISGPSLGLGSVGREVQSWRFVL